MTASRIPHSEAGNPLLRVFSVHEDAEADGRTRRVTAEIERCTRHRCRVRQERWKLDLLTGFVRFREITIDEASGAHVLLVSFRSLEIPDPSMDSWFESVCRQRRAQSRPGLLLGLLGDEEEESRVGVSPVCDYLSRFAQRAGMEFAWAAGDTFQRRELPEFNRRFESLLPEIGEVSRTRPTEWTSPVVDEESFDYDFDWVALP